MVKKYMRLGMMCEDAGLFEPPPEGIEEYMRKCNEKAVRTAFDAIRGIPSKNDNYQPPSMSTLEEYAQIRLVSLRELAGQAEAIKAEDRSKKEEAAILLIGAWTDDPATCEKFLIKFFRGGNASFDVIMFILNYSPIVHRSGDNWMRDFAAGVREALKKEQENLQYTMAQEAGAGDGGNSSMPRMGM